MNVLKASLPGDGTYRVTTGQRAGRKSKIFRAGKHGHETVLVVEDQIDVGDYAETVL